MAGASHRSFLGLILPKCFKMITLPRGVTGHLKRRHNINTVFDQCSILIFTLLANSCILLDFIKKPSTSNSYKLKLFHFAVTNSERYIKHGSLT